MVLMSSLLQKNQVAESRTGMHQVPVTGLRVTPSAAMRMAVRPTDRFSLNIQLVETRPMWLLCCRKRVQEVRRWEGKEVRMIWCGGEKVVSR